MAGAQVGTLGGDDVADSSGFALVDRELPAGFDRDPVVEVVHQSATYSGFEGCDEHGTGLAKTLRRDGIDAVDVVGLATDYCVRATAMDASAQGLSVRVLAKMVAGVAAESTEHALDEMYATSIDIA